MRLTLIDGLIPTVWFLLAFAVVPVFFSHYAPESLVLFVTGLTAVAGYLIVVPFVYRKFGLPPMRLPRCACCGQWGEGFLVLYHWPRVTCRCSQCEDEFVVWMDGQVGGNETWERPVLVLKWPYVFGPYRRVEKPEPRA